MRHSLVGVLAAAALVCASAADGERPDFGGNWTHDPGAGRTELSEPRDLSKIRGGAGTAPQDEIKKLPAPPREDRVEALHLRIDQSGEALKILRTFILDGEKTTVLQTFALDGGRNINMGSDGLGEFVSRSSWEKNKLIHSGIQTVRNEAGTDEIYVQEEYELSKKGDKLTLNIRRISRQGAVRIKQVFIRQPGH